MNRVESAKPSSKVPMTTYLKARAWVEQGLYEKASLRLRLMRDQSLVSNPEFKFLRTLVGARIAIKSAGGNATVDERDLDPSRVSDPFLHAEAYFVRGLLFFHRRAFKAGTLEFQKAEGFYRKLGPSFADRELLSAFNAYSGMTNAGGPLPEPLEILQKLKTLERRSIECKNKKIMGLILRDKSEIYQNLSRFESALEDAKHSSRLLEIYGPKSDYDLALIQAADCCVDLSLFSQARNYLGRVLEPVDKRARFPHAMVLARMSGESIDPSGFEVVVPCSIDKWKRQFHEKVQTKAEKPRWNLSRQEFQLQSGKRVIRLKPGSLEGKLIKALAHGKASKAQLCEMLWPQECDRLLLDNRLHRLVSRTNRKLSNLIRFDGSQYSVTERVETTV